MTEGDFIIISNGKSSVSLTVTLHSDKYLRAQYFSHRSTSTILHNQALTQYSPASHFTSHMYIAQQYWSQTFINTILRPALTKIVKHPTVLPYHDALCSSSDSLAKRMLSLPSWGGSTNPGQLSAMFDYNRGGHSFVQLIGQVTTYHGFNIHDPFNVRIRTFVTFNYKMSTF